MNRPIAVVGASGFLGQRVVQLVAASGCQVRAIGRSPVAGQRVSWISSGDLLQAPLDELLAECRAVVNCAARVHVTKREKEGPAEQAYRAMNTDYPVRLAEAARMAGASRFVQISSVAAVATTSAPQELIDDNTQPRPSTPYGRSKLDADERLAGLRHPGFSVVSLRPPAIYGPGVRAWFALLMKAARAGLPLPLGGVENARSFAFADNIAGAVVAALHGDAQGSFIVTDSPPISTSELYRRLLAQYGRGDRVWRMPRLATRALFQAVLGSRTESVLGSAAFSGHRFAKEFNWSPPFTMDEALGMTVGNSRC